MEVKEKQEALEWFVNFSNMDLETIKPGDKAKLLVESEEYLSPQKDIERLHYRPVNPNLFGIPYEEGKGPAPQGLDERKKYYEELPEKFFGKMAWIFEIPGRDSPEYLDTLKAFQTAVIDTLHEFSVLGLSGQGIAWQGEMMIQVDWGRTFNLSLIPLAETHDKYTQLKLYQLLNGLPGQTIQECQGCKKYFLNATFRKKTFCSPRCMWRVNTAKRREADREGYNEYQAKLMKDRYREKNGLPRKKTKSRKQGKK